MNLLEKLLRQVGVEQPPLPKPEVNALQEALETGQQAKRAENYALALQAFDQAASATSSTRDTTVLPLINLNRAEVYIAQNEWQTAERLLQEIYQTACENNQRTYIAYTLDMMGVLAQTQNNLDKARDYYEEALETARGVRANGAEGRAMGHLAALYLAESNASYAVHLLREALPKLNLTGEIESSCYFVGLLGQALIATGQEVEGRQLLDRALRLSRQMHYHRYERYWGMVLGDRALAEGRCDDAYDHYKEALALFKSDTPSREHIHSLCQASKTTLALRDNTQAIRFAQQAINLSETLNDQEVSAQANGTLGMALLADRQYVEATRFLEAAAGIYEQIHNGSSGEIDILRSLATARSETHDDEQAISTYQRAAQRAEILGAQLELAQTHRDLGLLYTQRKQMPEAIRSWTTAVAIYEAEKQAAQVARLYCDIAAARKYLGQGQRAMKDYEQALMAINDLNGDWETRGIVLSNAANAYVDQGDIESAESFFNEAIAIARRSGNEVAETTRRGNYGWFLLAIGRPQQALAALQYALQMSKGLNLHLQTAIQTDNLGLAYDLLNEYVRALDYHRQAQEILQITPDAHWEQVFKANEANTLLALNEVEAANPLFEGALQQGRTDNDIELIVRGLTGQAEIAIHRQQYLAAGRSLEEATALARKADMRRLLADTLSVYSQQQAALNQPEKAAALWEEAHRLFKMLHMPQAKVQPTWLQSGGINPAYPIGQP